MKPFTRFFDPATTREERYRLAGFVVSFAALGIGFPLLYLYQPIHFDEAIWLVVADQMAQGNALYGDIYDHKPPGIFYVTYIVSQFVTTFEGPLQVLAYGDAATTQGLLVYVLRLLNYGVIALTGALVYVLGRRIDDQTTGIAASLVFLLVVYLPHFYGFYFLTEQWATFAMVLATILLLEDGVVWDVCAGIVLGIGVLFNQTVLLFGVAFIAFRAIQGRYRYNQSWDYVDTTLRQFGRIGVGFAVPVSVVLAVFYSRGLLTELLYHTVYLPLIGYSPPFTVWGRVLAFLSALPVWLLASGLAIWISVRVAKGQRLDRLTPDSNVSLYRDGSGLIVENGTLFVVLWAVFVSYPGATGFDAQHQLLFVFPPVALLAVIGGRRLLDAARQSDRPETAQSDTRPSRIRRVSTLFVGVLVVALVVSAGVNGVYGSNIVSASMNEQAEKSQTAGERVDGVAYTWPPQMNHHYYFNDDMEPAPTYFMTVYDESVSDRVIRDLERAETEYVVVSKGHVEDGEIVAERAKWFADEKVELAAYLNRHYEPVDETDDYVIFASIEDTA